MDGVSEGVAAGLGAALDGRTFTATSITGHDLVDGSTLTVAFEGGRVTVRGGGNTLGSQALLVGSTLRFGSPPISTMMWPGEALAAQDEWLTTIFLAGVQVALDGPSLTLTVDDDVVISLTEDS